MSQLYHEDIYKFDEPVKSYWETTSDTNNKYNKLEKNIQTNIVVIGGGYTGISCALSLAKTAATYTSAVVKSIATIS